MPLLAWLLPHAGGEMADDKMRKNIRIPLFVILRTPGVWRGARWRGPAERRCGGRPGQAGQHSCPALAGTRRGSCRRAPARAWPPPCSCSQRCDVVIIIRKIMGGSSLFDCHPQPCPSQVATSLLRSKVIYLNTKSTSDKCSLYFLLWPRHANVRFKTKWEWFVSKTSSKTRSWSKTFI